ncbi:MAG: GMC family oxidoreductase N-terminal domain-containing protein, partial [Planctomycetes bacterium]|nr:GMC family oxidoreductase N-terminal domain-containing protein [Planctomycetota bacterium]
PADTNPWIHVPVGYFKTMHDPATDWCYVTEPDPGLGGRALQWPRGRVLGGSSSINGLLYVRGQPRDYDHWRQMGNAGWAWDDVLPYFKRAEDQQHGADALHGAGGPLAVQDRRVNREICEAFIAACGEVGIPRNDDFNGPEQEGAGYYQLTSRNGRRCSAAVAYLKPIRHRRNLVVATDAHTESVLFDGRRAVGVSVLVRGERREFRARAAVVLSAGAINSPQLLMLSGVGPGAHLAAHGIDVLHDLPGVGRHLQDHLQIRSVYRCRRGSTLNEEVNNPFRRVLMGIEYALFRTGPLSLAASLVGVFTRTDPSLPTPDIQFHVQPLSADKPGEGLHKYPAFTSSVCQLRPESRGRIELKSADPLTHPAIHPNYLSTPGDQQVAVAALKVSRRICNAPALSAYVSEELLPGPDVDDDDKLLAAARRISQTIYHPTSTCRMGPDPMSVVDERLRVHGMERLRIADGSIMPTMVSGNTNAACIMIGEKAADLIREDHR